MSSSSGWARTTSRMRGVAAVLALAALVLVGGLASPVAAHSDLTSSTPANDATVAGPVDEVVLVFANPIDFSASSFEAIDETGADRPVGDVRIDADDRTVTITLAEPVIEGVVGIGYSIVAGDTHPRTGFITFGVTAPPPTPTPEPTATPVPEPTTPGTGETQPVPTEATPTTEPATPTPAPDPDPEPTETAVVVGSGDGQLPDLSGFLAADPNLDRMINAQTALRGIGYAGGVALVGALLFFGLISTDRPTGLRVGILVAAALATAGSGLALIATQAGIAAAGDTGALVDPGAWADVFSGKFALGTGLRIAGGLAALAVVRDRGGAAIAVAGVTALSFPFLGHGATRDPVWLVFPSDLVHVVAVAVWTGGLLMLLLGLLATRERSLSAAGHASVATINRFSSAAGFALAAAAVTGTILAATELDSPGALFDTSYGKRLVVKLVLVGALVVLGAFHRYRVIPRINREGAESPAVRKLLAAGAIEIAVMGLVVLVTALLVNAAA